jgi:hypothetical protein
MKRRNRGEPEEGGFVLVVVALVLVILLGFVALGVDTGILYSARASAQEAADAAALAGTFSFVTTPSTDSATWIANATAQAKAVATALPVMGNPITDADVAVTVQKFDPGSGAQVNRVIVDVTTTRTTYFAKAIGIRNATVKVHAVAESGPHASVAPEPKPFFLPNTILSGMDACDACIAGVVGGQMLINPTTRKMTPYGETRLGTSLVIKPQAPGGALQPSLFFLVDFDGPGGGADQIRDWIDGSETPPDVACNNMVPAAKGNKVSIKHGVDNLLGAPDDIYVDVGRYSIGGGAVSDVSKALISVPVWDVCASGFCSGGIPKVDGHEQVRVIGFATMFLEGIMEIGSGPNKEEALTGRLINLSGCSTTPTGGGSSVVGGFPLRLVRQ